MEFNYTIDPTADEPIMLIDRHIGHDSEDGEGIMGDKFCKELLFLDTLNKSKIHVWINSGGGSVPDGQQIYNTILKTKTKVDTHCVGMAASIAFPIFLAGRNRYMMDNAVAMMHPVAGGDHKSRIAFESAVNTMLSSRSFIPSEKITEMMNRTTWLTANECESLGLCEVEDSNEHNKPRKSPESVTVKALYNDFKSVVNKLIEDKKPIMASKVNNKLKLNDSANEDAQLIAIEQIENRATVAENKITAIEAENKTKIEALNTQLATLKAEKEAIEKEVKEAKDKTAADLLVANKTRATEFVKNQVTIGRIANEVELINHWTEQLTTDFDKNKVIVEKLPINKKAPNVINKIEAREIPAGSDVPSIDVNNTGGFVARMNAKVATNALNRFKQ